MTFAVTKYIYPLKTDILLSKKLGYKLDNPRTSDEIKIVKDFISETLKDSKRDEKGTVAPLLMRYGFSLSDLKEKLKTIEADCYALKYYNDNLEKSLVDIFAETWIIIRFEEDEEFDKVFKDRNELFHLVLTDKKTAYTKNFEQLASYCQLVSLLSNDKSRYHGESFLLQNNPYEIFYTSDNQGVYRAVENCIGYNFLIKHNNRATNWLYWLDGYENVISHSTRLDTFIRQKKRVKQGKKIRLSQKQSPKQKLLHVGSLLKTSYEHLSDPELMLLLLVSIIEYLITRNPDTSKFNVEDSISRQFKLKCAILIHNHNKEYDLTELNQELSKIYSQRSDLAHGNYKEDFNIDEIVDSVLLLYLFLNYILNEFINDRDLIDYLKDN